MDRRVHQDNNDHAAPQQPRENDVTTSLYRSSEPLHRSAPSDAHASDRFHQAVQDQVIQLIQEDPSLAHNQQEVVRVATERMIQRVHEDPSLAQSLQDSIHDEETRSENLARSHGFTATLYGESRRSPSEGYPSNNGVITRDFANADPQSSSDQLHHMVQEQVTRRLQEDPSLARTPQEAVRIVLEDMNRMIQEDPSLARTLQEELGTGRRPYTPSPTREVEEGMSGPSDYSYPTNKNDIIRQEIEEQGFRNVREKTVREIHAFISDEPYMGGRTAAALKDVSRNYGNREFQLQQRYPDTQNEAYKKEHLSLLVDNEMQVRGVLSRLQDENLRADYSNIGEEERSFLRMTGRIE